MTQHEETILDQKISGINLRILLMGAAFIVTGVITASTVYHGLVAEIQAGSANYNLLEQRVTTVEKRTDNTEQNIKALYAEKKREQ